MRNVTHRRYRYDHCWSSKCSQAARLKRHGESGLHQLRPAGNEALRWLLDSNGGVVLEGNTGETSRI
jgi:hypothetical protein